MAPEFHGRVRSLFDEALERPEPERLPFLQSVCRSEPAVLQAVWRLLEAHRGSEYFLETDPRPRKCIGRYLVTGELGRGAMGIVYEAIDPLIGRMVAVKVIHLQAFANAGEAQFLRDRLFREARLAGLLSHPGIVVVFDVGQEGEMAFIAMERVEGVSLYQRLSLGPRIPLAGAFDILKQASAALDYAHRNGVVHRDIKPANILLDKGVTVKVADFGIAKIISTERLTMTGGAMGTPSYMSPEQIAALPSDGRSDQFSLAVMAYELLTGSRPFQADSLPTLAHMIVYSDRPSARAANPGLPPAVDVVFHRSLSKLPKDRYPSCTEFVAALEQASKDTWRPLPYVPTPVLALPPAPPAVAGGKDRTAALVRGLLGAGVSLLILLILYSGLSPKSPQVAEQAEGKPAPPVVTQFTVRPKSIAPGSAAILHWDVTGAKEVVLDHGIGKVVTSGALAVKPLKATAYVLTATGSGGRVSQRVFVNVDGTTMPAEPSDRTSARQLYAEALRQRDTHPPAKARELFRQAADMGEAEAMVELGVINMENDTGGVGDLNEAARWFRKAAEAGNPSGMLHLGAMYYLGNGVPEDYKQAAIWYRNAADAGNSDAMYNLGRMYENGQGVARDLTQANKLYLQASTLGNVDAKDRIAQIKSNQGH